MKPYSSLHFVGIGGAGMSGIARLFLSRGVHVTGSDVVESDRIVDLRQRGAVIKIGHAPENVGSPDVVVVSSAIAKGNPELKAAHDRSIPVVTRAEMLGELMADYYGIAIAGTHGKTTTTSMVGLILANCGADPTVVIGGEVLDIGSNVRLGNGKYFVAEADESDGSFLKLRPQMGVITNIEADHLENYGSLEAIVDAFDRFLQGLSIAILGIDDPRVAGLAARAKMPLATYGLGGGDVFATDVRLHPKGAACTVHFRDDVLGRLELKVPGVHNIMNALGAVAVGVSLGYPFEPIKESLAKFSGACRRFEVLGDVGGILVVDDYAHHPTEIQVTLAAAQTLGRRVVTVFQPHRYTRTLYLEDALVRSFDNADQVIFTEIYPAGEQAIPGVSGEKLAQLVGKRRGRGVHFVPKLGEIPTLLQELCQPGDLVLTMGAGDVHRVAHAYLEQLRTAAVSIGGVCLGETGNPRRHSPQGQNPR